MARGIEGQNQVPGEPLWDPVPAPQSLAELGPERGEQGSSVSKPLPCRSTGPGFWVLPSGVSKAATLDDIFPYPVRMCLIPAGSCTFPEGRGEYSQLDREGAWVGKPFPPMWVWGYIGCCLTEMCMVS